MIKLIIQIPCWNEEESLPVTWQHLPLELPEFPDITVEYLVIDDGSTDRTIAVAQELGVHHILPMKRHVGLATAWSRGIRYALELGADYIINLDADNQYDAGALSAMLRPLVLQTADITIGCRPFDTIPHFSGFKRFAQKFGSRVISFLGGQEIQDATSGYRGFTRKAAAQINVFSKYTYTLETILHAGKMQLAITNVPVAVNEKMRESRLLRSSFRYILKSLSTLLRISILYNPVKFFGIIGSLFTLPAAALGIRYLYYAMILHHSEGKIQSLILFATLMFCGVLSYALGVIAHLLSVNRRMLEQVYAHSKRPS